ncbi:MAG: cation diffusion facilitator family transporter [Eubacteriales bacterium]|nr:cation diffusion facilitator family transporter [Eubacteriales bacterium]
MLDYIVRRIIGERNPTDVSVRKTCGTIASIVGISINLLLFAGKFIAGTLAGSISITADALNNLSDAASSVISLVSFRISAKPADRDHPFGHERFEYVASLIVSFIILIIGFELFTDSIDKIIHPAETEFSLLAVCVLVVSICFKLILYFFYRSVGRTVDSSVMMASSADSLSDVVSTGAVLVALFVSHLTGINLDGYIGAAVSIFIFISGLKILNENKNHIIGTAPDTELVEKIKSEARSHPEILGIHDMMIHNYGTSRCFATFHAEVDGRDDIFKSHDVIDLIERDVFEKYGVQCVIHLDPIETDNELVNELREDIYESVKGIDERLSVHDFRLVPGVTHTNLIFDVFVPFEVTTGDEELRSLINAKVKSISTGYHTVITFDRG